jgi:hypothetical protein
MSPKETKRAHDLEKLKKGLASHALAFCAYLFPNGKCVCGEYTVGSLGGEPGQSLRICLKGSKAGVWKDFAMGYSGNNLLQLLYGVRGRDFYDVCREAADWLNRLEDFYDAKDGRATSILEVAGNDKMPKYHPFHDLKWGSFGDLLQLSHSMEVSLDGLLLARGDGILKFFYHPTNGYCWSIVHREHLVRQDRRLDSKPFIFQDNSKAKARTLGFPGCPIGIPTDKPVIMLVEGSSDILAAYSLIFAENVETMVTPVTMLGASNNIHRSSLQHFQGKHILGFPDYDVAGINGMSRWEKQLDGIAATFKVFDYAGLVRDDGKPIKDLRDFLRVDIDQWEKEQDVRSPLLSFICPLLDKNKEKL